MALQPDPQEQNQPDQGNRVDDQCSGIERFGGTGESDQCQDGNVKQVRVAFDPFSRIEDQAVPFRCIQRIPEAYEGVIAAPGMS